MQQINALRRECFDGLEYVFGVAFKCVREHVVDELAIGEAKRLADFVAAKIAA